MPPSTQDILKTLCPQDSPGKNTGVGSPSLLQGIFPTQGSNPGLLHCRQILYQLSSTREVPRIEDINLKDPDAGKD